jgi:predicted PurR-regulated permease PerM
MATSAFRSRRAPAGAVEEPGPNGTAPALDGDQAATTATATRPAELESASPWPHHSVWHLTPKARLATFWVCIVLSLLFLWVVRGVLRPFIIALILAYLLNPVVTRVSQRGRLPRGWAVAGVYIILAMLFTWGVLVVLPVATREARELAVTLPRLLVQFQTLLAQEQTVTVFGAEVSLAPISDEITRTLAGLVSATSHRLVETAVQTVETLLKSLLALVATFYLLMAGDRIKHGVRNLTPPLYRREFGPLVAEMDRILGRFVRGELLLIIIMSVTTWVALSLLGIRYALILALIAGVLELIPFVGPIAAAVPALALALFQPSPHGWTPLVNASVVALTYFVLRHAEDYFVIPQVVGRVVELHPVLAMFAVFSGAAFGGVLGMFLGVPVAAVLRILARYLYHKLTEPTPTAAPAT